MAHTGQQKGFILLPVVLAITVIAAVVFMISQESALQSSNVDTRSQSKQVEQVARAGLAHATWQASNGSCLGDQAMTTVAFGPGGSHSYTATIDSPATATTSYSFTPDRDTWIKEALPDENNAGASLLSVKIKPGDSFRTLYHFDLATIPSNKKVVTATAWFYLNLNDNQGTITLHPVTTDWTESGATWNTIGSNFESAVYGTIPPQPASGVWVSVNLTALAQAWVNNPGTNYGILLNATVSDLETKFTSKEAGASQRPYLQVTTADGNVSPLTISATGTLTGNPSPANDITRTLTRTAVPTYQPASNLVLQPGPEGKDGWVNASNPNDNYGVTDEMTISGGANPQHFLTEFDLSAIPSGGRILSAKLEMHLGYMSSADPAAEFSIYRMTQAWTEGTGDYWNPGDGANWNTSNGSTAWSWSNNHDASSPVAMTRVNPTFDGWHSWDIKSLVQQWISGQQPNYGLLITGNANAVNAGFHSSDWGTADERPKLTITYACECGSSCLSPQGSGNLLMVVGDMFSLNAGDKVTRDLFNDWGYSVTLIDDDTPGFILDLIVAGHDVIYISESVTSTSLGTKLTDASIGVVSAEGELNDELGIASTNGTPSGKTIDLTDTSHYITAIFPSGPLLFKEADMALTTATGSLAPGAQELARFGGDAALLTLETNAALEGGGYAAGRRVLLPVGESDFDWHLTNNGQLIVQRAIQWGTGNTGGTCVSGNIRDEFASAVFNNSDGSLPWSGDWIELDSSGSGAGSGKVVITGGELRLNGTPLLIGDDPSLAREVDLSGHLSATLSFDYRTGSGVEPGEDSVVVEVSGNGGASWVVLEDFINEPASASGSRSYDISGYLAADTQVRFRINSNYGGPNEYFYVDNLDIAAGCTPPPPPAGDMLLLVVVDPGNLTAQEDAKKTLIESWGYTVFLIDESDSQANFDTALAANDVVYITEDVTASTVGTKLVNATIGVVTEEANLSDEFGFSDGIAWGSGVEIQIDDNTHYITQPFAGGDLTILTTSESLAYLTPSLAPDAALLGRIVGGLSLTAVMAGADVIAGRTAAGRRVLLPWGDNNFDVNHLNADGKTILKRAIEWGAGASGGGGGGTSPIAHWKLDETSGTTAVDSVGGHDGTLTNGPTWTTGQDNGALDFDGADDYVDLTSDAELDDLFVGGATVMAWIYPRSWGESVNGRILDKTSEISGDRDGWMIAVKGDTPAIQFAQGFTGVRGFWRSQSGTVALNTWVHVAVVYDASSDANDAEIYLDGVKQSPLVEITPSGTIRSDASISLRMGNWAQDTTRTFDGIIDDVRIYDRMLSATEIANIAADGGGGGGGGGGGSGCDGTFRDEFNTVSFSNNDGTLNWAGDWLEVGESDGPTANDVRVRDDNGPYQLWLRDNQNGGEGVEREADLSGATAATLSFVYRRSALDNANDYVKLEISSNGTAGPWAELARFQGSATDSAYQPFNQDISGYISANTRIRLITSPTMGNTDLVIFDNIEIACTP